MVDLRQIERGDRDLDRARHRERRVALDAEALAGVEVERSDPDVGRASRYERTQLLFDGRRGRATRPPSPAARQTPAATTRIPKNRTARPHPRGCAYSRFVPKCPHSLQIVKIPYLGAEQVDDDVVGVDQHPVRRRKPFDPDVSSKSLLDLVGKLNGHRRDLPGRAPGGDHHVVGDVGLARQRDGDDFLRLVVVERLEDELVKVFDVHGRVRVQRQRYVRSRGLLANRGTAVRPALERAAGDRRYQLGSCARIAVAEVGSGDRRRKTIAGALHSVQRLRLARRVDEPPEPTHRARRVGSRIITGAANHRNRHFAGQAPPIAP